MLINSLCFRQNKGATMKTECNAKQIEFQGLFKRSVSGSFDGGCITSDGGGLLLREVEKRRKIVKRFAACFTDHRNPQRIEHGIEELISQRVYALALQKW
jgi:hypothetical protein